MKTREESMRVALEGIKAIEQQKLIADALKQVNRKFHDIDLTRVAYQQTLKTCAEVSENIDNAVIQAAVDAHWGNTVAYVALLERKVASLEGLLTEMANGSLEKNFAFRDEFLKG